MVESAPKGPSAKSDALTATIDKNIAALIRHEASEAHRATLSDRVAMAITGFAGSLRFVVLHIVLFGGWIVCNVVPLSFVRPWDPSLVVIAVIASLEAIFISTFVLITQNRMAESADRRANLNLQISMLGEHETSRLIEVVAAIASRLDVTTAIDGELQELKRDIEPEIVLKRIEEEEAVSDSKAHHESEAQPAR